MENKDMMGKPLDDDEMKAVAGGVSTKDCPRVTQWAWACDYYVCKLCGMTGIRFADHADGCAVKNFPNPDTTWTAQVTAGLNSCWSCKHLIQKSVDYSDIYCGRSR